MNFGSILHETTSKVRPIYWNEKPAVRAFALGLCAVLLFSVMSMPLGNIFVQQATAASSSSALPFEIMNPDELINSIHNQPLVQDLGRPFISNEGQVDADVRYYADTFAGRVYVTSDGLTYALQKPDSGALQLTDASSFSAVAVKESFVGANPLQPYGQDQSPTRINYFVGDQSDWKTNIPAFNKVSFGQVWNGIDVDLVARSNNVEKIFTVGPGADFRDIQIALEGVTGIIVNSQGELVLATALGDVSLTKPVAFQEIGMEARAVQVSYVAGDNAVYGFAVGKDYDPNYALVIDPLLASTYIGGTADENNPVDAGVIDGAPEIAFDSDGNVYIAGLTVSDDYPTTTGPIGTPTGPLSDIVISRFDSDLSSLTFSTIIGGSLIDEAYAIAIDSDDNIYITGRTNSSDFPTTPGAWDETYNGGRFDVFVSKLPNDLSSLSASTFIGGSDKEEAWAIAINAAGAVYVVGHSFSADYPTTLGAFDTVNQQISGPEVIVTSLSSDLSALSGSTFIGGSNDSHGYGVAIGSTGEVYITGITLATNFPIVGGYDTSKSGHNQHDGFIAVFDSDLTDLLRSTYHGAGTAGGHHTTPFGIVLDSADNVYIAGRTASPGFPTTSGAYDASYNGLLDAFVSILPSSLASLTASTVIGTPNNDGAFFLDLSPSGVYINVAAGAGYPTTAGAYDEGASDAHISLLSLDLTMLLASTSIGGSNTNSLHSVAVDASGDVYVAGRTRSSNFPTTPGAYDTSHNGAPGSFDYFVSKFTADLSASAPSVGGMIAFTSFRDGNSEIYVMEPDGTGQTRLTNNTFLDQHPSISPDGSKIVFETNRDGNFEIYVMNSDGTGQTNLSNNGAFEAFAGWSPDGTQIAFTSDRDGNQEIYVMDADGSPQTRLTTVGGFDAHPSWSPDGTQIAFDSTRDSNLEIYKMDADGSPQTRLTNHPDSDAFPDWKPDGTQIVFASDRDGDFEIFTMDSAGTVGAPLTSNLGDDQDPSWSPDGSLITYQFVSGSNYEIKVMLPGGGSQTIISMNPADDIEPDFGPDLVLPPAASPAISLESVSNLTPKFDVDEVFASGLVINDLPGDYVEVSWGDGEVTLFTPFAGAWGPVSHIYGSAAIGPATIQPFLFDSVSGLKATGSFAFVTVSPHDTTFLMNDIGAPATNTPLTVSGLLFDANTGQQLPEGQTITFTGTGATGLPDVTTGGITISDPLGVTIEACPAPSVCIPDSEGADTNMVLRLNVGGMLTFPADTQSGQLEIQNTGTDQFTFEVTEFGNPTPFTTDSFGAAPDQVNLFISAPNGTASVRLISTTGSTVGISSITTSNPLNTPQEMIHADLEILGSGTYGPTLVLDSGAFFARATAISAAPGLDVQANYAGDVAGLYTGSSSATQLYDVVDRTWGAAGDPQSFNVDTGTGISTIKCATDADGDGLCSTWETGLGPISYAGTTYNLCDFECPAGEGRKDVYVEIDSYTNHVPPQAAINNVIAAFGAVPNGDLPSPQVGTGIAVHVKLDDSLGHPNDLIKVWADANGANNAVQDDFEDTKANNFGTSGERGGGLLAVNNALKAKAEVYHYGISVHGIGGVCDETTPSGIGETPGNDFVISLGCGFFDTGAHAGTEGDQNEFEGTLMHELGHNLNLGHGGPKEFRTLPSGNSLAVPATPYAVTDAGPGDATRAFTITGIDVITDQARTGTVVIPVNVFTSNPGTTTISSVSQSGDGSAIAINTITPFVSGTGNSRLVTLKVTWTTSGASTGTTGDLGTFTVNLNIATTSVSLPTPTTPAAGPQLKINVGANADLNCKVNYQSVMSYTRQFDWYLTSFYLLDFSRNAIAPAITEANSNAESNFFTSGGIANSKMVSAYNNAGSRAYRLSTYPNVDWDGNNAISGASAQDSNYFGITGCQASANDVQRGYDDWANVQLDFKEGIGSFDGQYSDPRQTLEITGKIGEEITDQVDASTATTTASPPGGTYSSSQLVTLTSDEPAIIYYTTDNSTPTESSPSGPSPVQLTISANTTLKFFSISVASGNPEEMRTEKYIILGLSLSSIKNVSSNTGTSITPAVAISGTDVFEVWSDNTGLSGSNFDIFVKISNNGGTSFGNKINLSSNSGISATPSVAISPTDGKATVVWSDNTGLSGSNFDILRRTITAGGTLSTTTNLSSNSGISATPSVAISPTDGKATVVWSDNTGLSGSNFDILRRTITAGGTLGTTTNLSSNSGISATPSVAISPTDGKATVVWSDKTGLSGLNFDIFMRTVTSGGTLGTTTNLSSNSGISATPSVAISPTDGKATVVWSDNTGLSGSNFDIFMRTVTSGGTLGTTTNLSSNTGISLLPSVAVSTTGKAFVTWTDTTGLSGINTDIFMRTITSGGTLGTTTNLSSNTGISVTSKIAVINDSKPYITWSDNTPGNFEILLVYGT